MQPYIFHPGRQMMQPVLLNAGGSAPAFTNTVRPPLAAAVMRPEPHLQMQPPPTSRSQPVGLYLCSATHTATGTYSSLDLRPFWEGRGGMVGRVWGITLLGSVLVECHQFSNSHIIGQELFQFSTFPFSIHISGTDLHQRHCRRAGTIPIYMYTVVSILSLRVDTLELFHILEPIYGFWE